MVSTRSRSKVNSSQGPTKLEHEGKADQQRHNERTDSASSSGQGDLPVRAKKRARSSRTATKPHLKKNAEDKQRNRIGLMHLPIELLTEIAYFLGPGDLLTLVRVNKPFRNMLLQRSAIKVWQNAEKSIPSLRGCPVGMSQPQYAALLFSKYCTLCGARTTARPDIYIRARLCASCRDTELQELNKKIDSCPTAVIGLVNYTTYHRPKKDNESETHGMKNSIYALRQDIEQVIHTRNKFLRARNRKELEKWDECKRKLVELDRQAAHRIMRYIDTAEASRGEELEEVKKQRREEIVRRLKELGWTEEDMAFRRGYGKPWHTVVEVSKPLTDRIWNNIMPKLTHILEENRERNNVHDTKKRRIDRRARVDQFLMDMKYHTHPFAPILEELGVAVPPPPNLSNTGIYVRSRTLKRFMLSMEVDLRLANPFPMTQTALKWDCLSDLSEVDMRMDEVEDKLGERTEEIEGRALEWRSVAEQRLVEKFEFENGEVNEEVVLSVKGSTDLTIHLPKNTRFLLRADTVFKRTGSSEDASPPFACLYYPNFVSSGIDCLHETVDEPHSEDKYDQERSLDNIIRNIDAEQIIKLLLWDLGMPDVAYIELQIMSAKFVCGRCSDKGPMTWDEIVSHYIRASQIWNKGKGCKSAYDLRHPVVYRNIHSLEPTDSLEQLVRILPLPGIKTKSHKQPVGSPHCYLCEGTGRPATQLMRREMLFHMQDFHNIKDPSEGIHYGIQDHEGLGDEWHKKWDTYNDSLCTTEEGSTS